MSDRTDMLPDWTRLPFFKMKFPDAKDMHNTERLELWYKRAVYQFGRLLESADNSSKAHARQLKDERKCHEEHRRNTERYLKGRNAKLEAENNDLNVAHQAEIDRLKAAHNLDKDLWQGFLDAEEDNFHRAEQEKSYVEERLAKLEEDNQGTRCYELESMQDDIRHRKERDEARDFLTSQGFPRAGDEELAGLSVFRPRTPDWIGGDDVFSPSSKGSASEDSENKQERSESRGSPGRGTKRPHSPDDEGSNTKHARTDPDVGRDYLQPGIPEAVDDLFPDLAKKNKAHQSEKSSQSSASNTPSPSTTPTVPGSSQTRRRRKSQQLWQPLQRRSGSSQQPGTNANSFGTGGRYS
ncbi:hypothetical protein LTR17_006087 [Elasticomyces elasticus]|nr:hypothetical protein LTR17_006087 [Elasticomyces elasticus]